jgi:hypothetical protein
LHGKIGGVIHPKLTFERNLGRLVYPEILFHDVKDRAIIKIIDAHKVAVLLPPVEFPHALPCDNNTIETVLVVLWVLLPNLLAGVKEAGLSRAKSANAGMWIFKRAVLNVIPVPK